MKKIIILTLVFAALGCNKSNSETGCDCNDKINATLKIYHDIQCVTTPCFRHEVILESGEKAIIQNLNEFKIEEVDQKISFCADKVLESYPVQMHVSCLKSIEVIKPAVTACANTALVKVEDKTGLDGCGWVLQMENKEYLEAMNIDQYQDKLKNGNQVKITFEYVNDIASVCMIGKMIKICSFEIVAIAK